MGQEIANQFVFALSEWTSFQVGSFNLANIASNLQTTFLDSNFIIFLQVISALITIGLGVAAFLLVVKRKEFEEKNIVEEESVASTLGSGLLHEQWNDIMRHVDSSVEGEWKFAVIEADALVDKVLKNYFPGDTMGERLMNIDKTKLLSIDELWEAHKIRNRLSHDPNYFLRHAEALRAVRLFEATLRELGAVE